MVGLIILKAGIELHDGRNAIKLADEVQVIDTETQQVIKTLKPGKGVLHMEFTPRGEHVWISARDDDRVSGYDTRTFERIAVLEAVRPSGIFFTARAHRIGL